MLLSPAHNENENVIELHRRLSETLQKIDVDYELIFVNDGSTDNTFQVLYNLYENDPEHVRLIDFSRNFGQHIAVMAGVEKSSGQHVVLMDSDLQDPPEEIERLYAEINKGFDCVYGIRQDRQDSWFKKATSNWFWVMMNKLSGHDMPQNQSMLRIMNRRFADALLSMPDQSPFISGMFAWVGFKQTTLAVRHAERIHGETKYSLSKMLTLAWTATTSFSSTPLKLASYCGFVFACFAFGIGSYYLMRKFFWGLGVPGWTSIIVSVFFVGGVQLLVLGIIGEYLDRMYRQVLSRPRYLVNKALGFKSTETVVPFEKKAANQ